MRWIDNFLNKVTMYKLLIYVLLFLLAVAEIFSLLHIIGYKPVELVFSVVFICAVAWVINKLFAWAYDAPSNPESTWITALILALIITPPQSFGDMNYYVLAGWAAALAIASKYILAIGKKHIFNPAAIGVALTALLLNQSASWWIGTAVMLPFTILTGFLIGRKVNYRGTNMVIAFFISALVSIVVLYEINGGGSILTAASKALLEAPLVFFGTIMLTEPMTSPGTEDMQISYGILVGLLFSPYVHIGDTFSTPELALLVGNAFAYLFGSKRKLILTLKERIKLSPDTLEFVFNLSRPLAFVPGQYLEWTLAHQKTDNRGIRRYFTIASAPTDKEDLRLGIKFYEKPSSFKQALINLQPGQSIVASQLSGDFVLPENKTKKIVWLAGGIGITPFVSMTKYLLAKNEQRNITLLYSNRRVEDVAYKKLFDFAGEKNILRPFYTLTDKENVPVDWLSQNRANYLLPVHSVGIINAEFISSAVSDYKERDFYISGPQAMVKAFEKVLRGMDVANSKIHTDFFPGF